MNRIDKKFKELKKRKQKAFIAFVTAGYPNLASTKKIILALEKAGVDIVEVGIPFSDPIADGPTIQESSEKALRCGANIAKIMNIIKDLRKVSQVPLVFMTYYNLVFANRVEKFIKMSKQAGADGIIISDMPPEEAKEVEKYSRRYDFDTIFLAAPTSTNKRIKLISGHSKGFVYYVSLTGVTGARRELPKDILASIKKVKGMTSKPVCVGFGVSTKEQAKMISKVADGVIVGSAVISNIKKNENNKDLDKRLYSFVKPFVGAVKG